MDVYTHTVIAVVFMGACYLWGKYLTKLEILDGIVTTMLDTLENEGFIRTEEDEDGEKCLVPISEIETKLIEAIAK
mgnify:FL=1|jgi:DNA-binding MarR family transcriptional regulator